MKAIHGLALASAALAAFLAAPAWAQAGRTGAAAPRPAPITAARLVGRWGDNGDCRKYVVFRGDGTFLSYTGGEGSWRLAGTRLTMAGRTGAVVLNVVSLDRAALVVANANGTTGRSTRC